MFHSSPPSNFPWPVLARWESQRRGRGPKKGRNVTRGKIVLVQTHPVRQPSIHRSNDREAWTRILRVTSLGVFGESEAEHTGGSSGYAGERSQARNELEVELAEGQARLQRLRRQVLNGKNFHQKPLSSKTTFIKNHGSGAKKNAAGPKKEPVVGTKNRHSGQKKRHWEPKKRHWNQKNDIGTKKNDIGTKKTTSGQNQKWNSGQKRHRCDGVCVCVLVCGLVGVLVCVGVFVCVFGLCRPPFRGPPFRRTAFRRSWPTLAKTDFGQF